MTYTEENHHQNNLGGVIIPVFKLQFVFLKLQWEINCIFPCWYGSLTVADVMRMGKIQFFSEYWSLNGLSLCTNTENERAVVTAYLCYTESYFHQTFSPSSKIVFSLAEDKIKAFLLAIEMSLNEQIRSPSTAATDSALLCSYLVTLQRANFTH